MLRRESFLFMVVFFVLGLVSCDPLNGRTQLDPTQPLPQATQIHLPPIETETSMPVLAAKTETPISSEDPYLGPDDYMTHEIEALDKEEGVVYGKLSLQIPLSEWEHFESVTIRSFSVGLFDKWMGGVYYIYFPKDVVLEYPVLVTLTYTEEALAHYLDLHPDLVESDLTISSYSETFNQYFWYESEVHLEEKRLSTSISEFEAEQFSLTIMEKSKCQTPKKLNLESCEDQTIPDGTNLTERQYWINLCHQKRAIQLEDLQICEHIKELSYTQTNTVSEDVCKSKILVLSDSGSVDLCRQISEEGPLEKCIRHFAVVSNDLTLCDEMSTNTTREYCYSDVALNSIDLDVCSMISTDAIKQGCIAEIAVEKLDPDLCSMVSEEPSVLKADCYSRLAEELQRPDLCEYVSPPFEEQYKARCIESAQ